MSAQAELYHDKEHVCLLGGKNTPKWAPLLFAITTKVMERLFVCVEVLRPCQQLRSCQAGQLAINTVHGQA